MSEMTIYITGAASGLGLEMARRYAQQGANLALFDLQVSEVAQAILAEARHNDRQQIQFFQVDVTQAERLTQTVQQAAEQLGLPQLALHCAGINNACGPFETLTQAQFEKTVQVNLFGSRNFAAATLPFLERAQAQQIEPPRLVFIASLAGLVGNFGYSPYCASKFGVVGLAQTLRIELQAKGIKVQVICPPEVDTPMVHAEHKTIHPVTLKLKLMAGALTLDEAVTDIMRGVQGKGFYIIPGKRAKATYLLNRLLPDVLSRALVDHLVAGGLK